MRLESIPIFLLGFGLVADLVSLFMLISTIVSRKYSSGLPGVGLICYALFMLSALVPSLRGRFTLINALLLGVVLICFHVVMHWFHGRIEKRLKAKMKDDDSTVRWSYL
jgi:ABC-type tungstate transport system substrate-binding protein